MGAIIQRFRAVLGINGSERSSQLVTDISTLFDQIRFMNTPLTNAHFNEIQELLTTYYEQTHNSVSAYRKILVDHRENTQGKNIILSDEK